MLLSTIQWSEMIFKRQFQHVKITTLTSIPYLSALIVSLPNLVKVFFFTFLSLFFSNCPKPGKLASMQLCCNAEIQKQKVEQHFWEIYVFKIIWNLQRLVIECIPLSPSMGKVIYAVYISLFHYIPDMNVMCHDIQFSKRQRKNIRSPSGWKFLKLNMI